MGRTLIVERHDWETSGSSHQVQIPTDAYAEFFGTFVGERLVRIFDPPTSPQPTSHVTALFSHYELSDTYRINRVLDLGSIGHGAVLLEEQTELSGQISYDLWWFVDSDATRLLAMPYAWRQAKGSQHGPGRRFTVLDRSGPRTVPSLPSP